MSGDFGQQQFQRQQFRHKPSDLAKSGVDHESIKAKLKIPSLGLLITGIISVVLVLAGTVGGLIYGSSQTERIQRELVTRMFGAEEEEASSTRVRRQTTKKEKERKELRQSRANTVLTLSLGGVIISALMLCSFYVFAVAGGILMGQLRNYQVCKIACIMALIPVISPLLVAGIPFGIIGLAKLRNPEVKKAFT
ncbi:MAG: hypothetical protein ACR2NP_19600 [Pirellulaceae bacterium]